MQGKLFILLSFAKTNQVGKELFEMISASEYTNLPELPGVYKYFNAEGELLYVGKAKNLKKRVSSYFSKTHADRKTARLVSRISGIEFTLVDSEFDALLLENSLIKQHQPRYNINLKDDKTYPYLLITREPFPRIFPTRRRIADKGNYFGPFASVRMMKALLELFRKVFTFRSCRLALTTENIQGGKFKVCLEYHLGKSSGGKPDQPFGISKKRCWTMPKNWSSKKPSG
jgi:excinuclease ABC subunit C